MFDVTPSSAFLPSEIMECSILERRVERFYTAKPTPAIAPSVFNEAELDEDYVHYLDDLAYAYGYSG